MATKGVVTVVGFTPSGNFIVQPEGVATMQVLADARYSGEPVSIALGIPTRGIHRQRFRRGLRLIGSEFEDRLTAARCTIGRVPRGASNDTHQGGYSGLRLARPEPEADAFSPHSPRSPP